MPEEEKERANDELSATLKKLADFDPGALAARLDEIEGKIAAVGAPDPPSRPKGELVLDTVGVKRAVDEAVAPLREALEAFRRQLEPAEERKPEKTPESQAPSESLWDRLTKPAYIPYKDE